MGASVSIYNPRPTHGVDVIKFGHPSNSGLKHLRCSREFHVSRTSSDKRDTQDKPRELPMLHIVSA